MTAQTIPALFRERIQKTPQAPAHYVRDEKGNWLFTTWEEAGQIVRSLVRGLISLGMRPGGHIGIMAPASQTWELLQMAVLSAGGVVVGVDPSETGDNVNAIIRRADVSALVVQEARYLDRLDERTKSGLRFVLAVDDRGDDGHYCIPLSRVRAEQEAGTWEDIDASSPEAAATIIFTSGTTGTPKGICYTHRQAVLACRVIVEAFPGMGEGSKLVCWLPLSNLFQRMINHCAVMINGSTFFVTDPGKILDLLPEITPDVFIGVPRFFEKVYEGLIREIQKKPAPVRGLIGSALRVGQERARSVRENRTEKFGNSLLYSLLDPLVLKRLRKVLGGKIRFMVSGSAPMPEWLLDKFQAMGLLILEAYGISENIVPMAINRPYAYKFGTVGKPLPANEILLSKEKEVLVKGEGLCTAYYTGETEEVELDSRGYLHTGDVAAIDDDGFINLIGRRSEMIKTSTGRRVSPAGIEDRLRTIPSVEHAVIFGDNRKHLIAVLVVPLPDLSQAANKEACSTKGRQKFIPKQFIAKIKQQVQREIEALPRYQRPAGLILTAEPFTVEKGELTSNLKLRRQVIREKYKKSIDDLYTALSEAGQQGRKALAEAGQQGHGSLKVITA
ncbi:MAG: AMP-binding protein [Desulfohalobiaceae bacterium]|nr:AMP-binding protein [Desulfohalobiaceae bacterium]